MRIFFKAIVSVLLAYIISASIIAQPSYQETTVLLNIPPRLQWPNNHGYCGETAIQSIYLYYGSYISQSQVRNIPGSEVLVGMNAEHTLQKISLVYESWDNTGSIPQYQNYLQWIKVNIKAGYPVIITGYAADGTDPDYDHIYLAVGVQSSDFTVYNDNDVLIYADFFSSQLIYTPFSKVWDTRDMTGNGANLQFAIPRDMDYGIAVKGIDNLNGKLLPVTIKLAQNSEPNVSVGEKAATFNLNVKVSSLNIGTPYYILRFSTFNPLKSNYANASLADNIIKFLATDTEYQFSDTVSSSGMAFYRCVAQDQLVST